jgi:MtrB/PioB family decaheme-associated outer membrane protein
MINHNNSTQKNKLLFVFFVAGSIANVNVCGAKDKDEIDLVSAIDTDKWQCDYCEFTTGVEAKLNIDAVKISDFEYRFGNYSGLQKSKTYFAGGELIYFGDEAKLFEIDVSRVGLDSVVLNSEYSVLGEYKLALQYVEIPTRQYASLHTPFENIGGTSLSLPAGWVFFGEETAPLDVTNWYEFDLAKDWKKIKLEWQHKSNDLIDYKVNFQRIKKQGIREFSAAQLWNVSYLPLSFNHQIDQLDTRINYRVGKWLVGVDYQLSSFDNAANSLTFYNPFVSTAADSQLLQVATEPDNHAFQFGLKMNYHLKSNTWLKLRATSGKAIQDQLLLPYTINSELLGTETPAEHSAKISNRALSIRLYSRPSTKFTLRGSYRFRDKRNKTQRNEYFPVINDSYVASAVTNTPFSYQTNKISLAGDWRFEPSKVLTIESRREVKKRDFSMIKETINSGVETKLKITLDSEVQLDIKGSYFKRDVSNQNPDAIPLKKENPLMRRYSQSARDESKLSFQVTSSLGENVITSFTSALLDYDYSDMHLGVRENTRMHYGLDVDWYIDEMSSFTLYYLKEANDTLLAASQEFSFADWFATNNDGSSSWGLNMKIKKLFDQRADLSFSYDHSTAKSKIVSDNGSVNAFPDISSKWNRAGVRLDFYYSDEWTFNFRYQFDSFESDDSSIGAGLPLELNNLMTFGAGNYNYQVSYLTAGFTYQLF